LPAERLAGFGTSIFTEMSALAERTNSINLGQGFPDEDGPIEVLDAAAAALHAGANQYAPLPGVPALRTAIAAHQRSRYGLVHDPDTEVQVTFGATEAIAAALLGLCNPGDEVIALDPTYDSYAAGVALAGARLRRVALHPPTGASTPPSSRRPCRSARGSCCSTRPTTRPGACSTAPSSRPSRRCAASTT
jgi:N-succinyldiaminopimelate aminotransferase